MAGLTIGLTIGFAVAGGIALPAANFLGGIVSAFSRGWVPHEDESMLKSAFKGAVGGALFGFVSGFAIDTALDARVEDTSPQGAQICVESAPENTAITVMPDGTCVYTPQ
jgi:hypothetical protein